VKILYSVCMENTRFAAISLHGRLYLIRKDSVTAITAQNASLDLYIFLAGSDDPFILNFKEAELRSAAIQKLIN